MKIVHISTYDSGGGAAIACRRHCECMIQAGIESRMVVAEQKLKLPHVIKPYYGLSFMKNRVLKFLAIRIYSWMRCLGTYSLMFAGRNMHLVPEVKNADVIFIHWVNDGCMSVKGIERVLSLGKPTYFYLHDMSMITGGCHHSFGCDKYKDRCSDCPNIGRKSMKSLSFWQLRYKVKSWNNYPNLSFVTPSTWLNNVVRRSAIAASHAVFTVPNVIDTKVYKPYSINTRCFFNLSSDKKVLLLGAASFSSIYKGADYLHEYLSKLDSSKYEGLVIGCTNSEFTHDLKIRIVSTGYLCDDLSLVLAYNACDAFVITSIAENYPNVILEAMACGKPCIGFDTGGIPDLIKDKETGYLVGGKSVDGLLDATIKMFSSEDVYKEMTKSCVSFVESNNSYNRPILDIYPCLSNSL